MGRKEDLQRQLEELTKAQNAILNKTADCMQVGDKAKVGFYDSVVPLLRTLVESKIKNGKWSDDYREMTDSVFKKCLTSVFGGDVLENLEKV